MSAPKELWPVILPGGGLLCIEDEEPIPQEWPDRCSFPRYVRATPLTDAAEEMRWALMEIRSRLHAAGRRPEECYEMTLIDVALAAARSLKEDK